MIASLRGTVLAVRNNVCTVDVHGVGYAVHITPVHRTRLDVGNEYSFLTSLIVREDSMTLFGFENTESLELFDALLSVSGVGPRSALAILAELTPADILTAVVNEDDAVFRRVSGIGPKTAKLIVVQLAGKLTALTLTAASEHTASAKPDVAVAVVQALVGLGWNERIAREALDSLEVSPDEETSAVLKRALVSLSRGA